MKNSFGSRSLLRLRDREFEIHRLDVLEKQGFKVAKLPYSLRVLLENLLRREDGETVTAEMIRALAGWSPKAAPKDEISFMPSRVLLQDLTGVPAVVDLAAMRDAMRKLGGSPSLINPLQPVELVIDHSVQIDEFGSPQAFQINSEMEFGRNVERYAFLRWGQKAFRNLAIVPPDTGICHQINLEFLARVVFVQPGEGGAKAAAYPDTLVGADSHTTMVNGLGVLGWGVGGIEAEAAMLGQSISMLIPEVIGVRLSGQLPEGSTATDLVLTITQMLRKRGVVNKFVEYFGPGLDNLPLADRATIANMSPEYGSTCGIFPVDDETLRYMRLTGRSDEQVALVEAYCKEQGLFRTSQSPEAEYTDVLHLDLSTIEPSIAGPKRPQDRVPLSKAASAFKEALPSMLKQGSTAKASGNGDGLHHGSVVIAAITSCTNTSNPALLMAAGLVAKKAVERGLQVPSWVKTSLAPGSMVVTEYLRKAGLTPYLDKLRFNLVGYGCTTCIGNAGPLPKEVSDKIAAGDLVVASVLSGNRNFEGRIHAEVRANYLMSPPLVVAFALAGHADWDVHNEPLGKGSDGKPVYLKDIWPTQREVDEAMKSVSAQMFRETYDGVYKGSEQWQKLPVPEGETYQWDAKSTYIRNPPYFDGMQVEPPAVTDIHGARVLVYVGDSITTDHISPAGSIRADSPAGKYLQEHNVGKADFNSYGARRGNHEVMMRGTFANTRLKNRLAPQKEGPYTRHLPDGVETTIFEAAEQYRREKVPVIILAGKEYGSGSSRDWAAKGPLLLGARAAIVESFERIHRSNLVGMGILPLQYLPGDNAEKLGLTGEETFDITGLQEVVDNFQPGRKLAVTAHRKDGSTVRFETAVRIDTPQEARYYRHGGILQYVLRQLLQEKSR